MSVKAFMPFYVRDYLADTTNLTLEEHGAYTLLLLDLWCKDGSTSADPARLARTLGVSKRKFRSLWKGIGGYFDENDGELTHSRITAELDRAKEIRRRRSRTGKKAAEARWQDAKRNASRMPEAMPGRCHPQSHSLPASTDAVEESSDSLPRSEPAAAVLSFPVVGKGPKSWRLTADQLAEWSELYPGVNVEGECRRALAWCKANPTKRKTARGMPAFLVRWLGRAQDRPAPADTGQGRPRVAPEPEPPALEADPSAVREWERIKGELTLNVDARTFDTWFRPTVGVAVGDDVLTVAVPGQTFAEYMPKRFGEEVAAVADVPLVEYVVGRAEIQEQERAS